MKMKKIISVCLCICLMSGCDKSLRHGRPANAVVEDKGSEGVPTHSLTSDTSKASASKPSNTPTPTPEPSNPALPASGNVDTGSSVGKYVGHAIAVIVSVIAVCGGYKLLYRFADIKPVSLDEIQLVEDMPEGYKECSFINGHFFDWDTNEFVEEIPVYVKEGVSVFILTTYYYKPNSSKLKPLKTLLRKIFRIKVPKSHYDT